MPPKLQTIAMSIMFVVISLWLTGSFLFGDVAELRVANVPVPSVINMPEEHPVPKPFNASLGFEKIYYISLPTHVHHSLVLICSRTDRQDHMRLAFYLSGVASAEVTILSLLV